MRIAMVSEHASPLAALGGVDAGGQNVHVAALSAALGRRGADVLVHTRRDDPELPAQVEMAPRVVVDHVDAGPDHPVLKDDLLPHMDEFAEALSQRWKNQRPDLVHAHFWMSGYATLKAARRLGIPVVQTFHALGVVKRRYQGEKDTSPEGRLAIEQDIIRRADHIVATCTDEMFELIRLGAEGSQLTVVPCGVDLSLFKPDGPKEAVRPGVRRLVTIGRLVERKGIGNLVCTLPRLPDTELVVVGGPDAEELRRDAEARRLSALAEELGVADRVQLRGRVRREQVPALLRSADAVVCAPWYEPFGIVPLEAMACGVPVVASAVGGMIDTVVDDVTGVHVAPRDPERLATALSALLDDPHRRVAYGRAGVKRARRLYDWERVGDSTLEVYAELLRERRARTRRSRTARHGPPGGRDHLEALTTSLSLLEGEIDKIDSWGERLARMLVEGGRLLAVGNGGSAAEAQHLTGELVGRYCTERQPLSAICLHADTSSLTAISNDYGADEAFARQVRAHARAGDVLVALSTSGESANVLAAVEAAKEIDVTTWSFTGAAPNPLAMATHEAVCVAGGSAATVQELHLVAVHLLCGAVDRAVARRSDRRASRRAL